MTLAFSRPAVRPFATLLAALVLASSAAVALAADTHAAKPVPHTSGDYASCRAVQGATTYQAWFLLNQNKGKWVHVDVDYKLGADTWIPYATKQRHETSRFDASITMSEPSESSSWRLTFVNRKGVVVDAADVTTAETTTCS